jgi:malonyl-CoA O-methyltransferase
MIRTSAEAALPNARAARRAFDRAAGFDAAAAVHDETRRRLFERLALTRLEPRIAVDLGAATARGSVELAGRYPDARVLALDTSLGMLRAAQSRTPSTAAIALICADAHALPLGPGSAQLVFANLVLPWCLPHTVFAEAARVLGEGGLFAFATLGPDTLAEIRRAWAAVDDSIHVHAFFDMHDLGDLALAAGLTEPVLDVDRIEVSYADLAALVRDLRACGAVNVAAGRRRSLTGARRWAAFEARLRGSLGGARLTVTLEVVFGQAWGRGPQAVRGASGEFGIAVDQIGRRFSR